MKRNRPELRRLLELAAPLVVTQLASMMLGVVDTMMVGRMSVEVLAAAALGHVWTFGTLVFAMGVIYGMDPLVTQAHGSGDPVRQGRTLQRGLIIAGLVSIPIAVLGSINMDIRSFALNAEIGLICYDRALVQQLCAIEDGYLREARQLDLQQWRSRPTWRRSREGIARLADALM